MLRIQIFNSRTLMEGSTDTTLEKISGDGDRWLTVATKAG